MPSGGIVTREEIDAAATRRGVPAGLYEQVIRKESGGRVDAGSPAGAYGPAQLMPDTARGLGVDIRDPLQNLDGGARYLRQQYDRFGHRWDLALSAYNSGPAGSEASGQIEPIAETQDYVKTILGWWRNAGGNDGGIDWPNPVTLIPGLGPIIGGIGSVGGDVAGAITDPITGAISGIGSTIAGPFVAVYNVLVSGDTWIRVGLFVGGMVVAVLGVKRAVL